MASIKKPLDAVSSDFDSVYQCIRYNPWLQTESRALLALFEAINDMIEFRNDLFKKAPAARSGLETWLRRKLYHWSKCTAEELMDVLEDIALVLRDNPKEQTLARAIERILWANKIMHHMHSWLNNL
jgi:hypothetical protein